MSNPGPEMAFFSREIALRERGFFSRTDWLSFGAAALIGMVAYMCTLSPEVTLDWSGMQATGATYGGSGPPPGAPLWSIYAWLFIRILPLSNFAWRIAVSSAVAGALTCGTVGLTISRGSLMLLEKIKGFKRLEPAEESQVRFVCGVAAGLGFGFHGNFWNLALTVAPDALGLLMLSSVFCLLLRWSAKPRQIRYLYAAAFIYGLSLSVQISLAALAPVLLFLVLFLRPTLGRDLLAMVALVLGLTVVCFKLTWLPGILEGAGQFDSLWRVYRDFAILYAVISIWLVIRSRCFLANWRTALTTIMLCVSGLSAYFYLPLASMTNPPANWGYARTVEGFYHMLRRGQFEKLVPIDPIAEPVRYFAMLWQYFCETVRATGWVYLAPCMVILILGHRIRGRQGRWMLGLGVCVVGHTLLMLAMLNVPPDKAAWSMSILYFNPSHMLLMIGGGYGLVVLGSFMGRCRAFTRSQKSRAGLR